MKRLQLALASVFLATNFAQAQTSFTDVTAVTAWNAARWNNSTDGPTYAATYTAGQDVSFTSGTYAFAGMGASTNVGNLTLASGVTVNFASVGSTFATGGTVRTINVGSGATMNFAAQVISTAAGTGFNKTGAGTMIITTGSTYAGGFTLNAGTVVAGGVNSLGAGGTLNLNGGILSVNSSTNRDYSGKYTGGISIGGNVQFGDAVNVSAGTGNMTFNNAVALGTAIRTITIGGTGTYTFGGGLSGGTGGGLTVASTSSGSLVLNGANTYTGGTTVSSGTLTIGATTGSLASSGALTVNGGTLNLNNTAGQTVAALSGSGGTIALASGVTLTADQTTTTTFSGVLSGTSGGLTKSNSGTLTLSGANTYTGNTTISGGTLQLGANHVFSNSAALILNGGTLAANGKTDTLGILTLGASSTLDFGSSAAALVFADSSGSSWTGTLTLLNYSVSTQARFGSNANGLTAGQLASISASGFGAFALDGSGYLTAAAIPEPSTYAAILGVVALGGGMFRRRKRQPVS